MLQAETQVNTLISRNKDIEYIVGIVERTADRSNLSAKDPQINAKVDQIAESVFKSVEDLKKIELTQDQKSKIIQSQRSFIALIIRADICKQVVLKACEKLSDNEISALKNELMKHKISSEYKCENITSLMKTLFGLVNQDSDITDLLLKFNKQVEVILPADIQLPERLENLPGTIAEQVLMFNQF